MKFGIFSYFGEILFDCFASHKTQRILCRVNGQHHHPILTISTMSSMKTVAQMVIICKEKIDSEWKKENFWTIWTNSISSWKENCGRNSIEIKKESRNPVPFIFLDSFKSCLGSKNQSNSLPVQRNAANARERARMRVLSSAFCRLKTKLPWVPADTKLSKLDTLRLATLYIQQLRSNLATTMETPNFDANSTNCQRQTSLVSFSCFRTIVLWKSDDLGRLS